MRKRNPNFRKDKKEDSRNRFKQDKSDFGKRSFNNPQPPKYSDKITKPTNEKSEDGLIRLNRYIANAGVCSRRDADKLIEAGEVSVNGKVITELGFKVKSNDKIKYKGKLLKREKPVYVLLNKPKGFITTMEDPKGRRTIMELVKHAAEERIFPVGRLDRETTGLIMLTNDGDLTKTLAHPSGKTQKIYHVELNKPISDRDFQTIVNKEFELEDGPVDLDGINIISEDRKKLGVELHSGRNRIVRRMFAHFGYEVIKLDRTVFAGLTKIDLPRGKWRYLNEKELRRLKHFNKV